MADPKSSNIAELQAMIAALQEQNGTLKAQAAKRNTLACKVGEKGGCCVIGLGRFPVSLYRDQWVRLIEFAPEITKFMEAHAAELKVKE
jgi:hypothetical protein